LKRKPDPEKVHPNPSETESRGTPGAIIPGTAIRRYNAYGRRGVSKTGGMGWFDLQNGSSGTIGQLSALASFLI